MVAISHRAGVAFGLAQRLTICLAGVVCLFTCAPARAAATIKLTLDQAQVLKLPQHTATIILGNPIIADVTLLRGSNSMILTGKSFGQTNLIALDSSGASLGESTVEVTAPKGDMIVQLGVNRQSYACDPRCEPTVNLGDQTKYTTEIAGQIKSRNKLAEPKN